MARYTLVDVFGSAPFSGNALPVVADAYALSTEEMQRITRWFGYSETAFLVAPNTPGADYRVRIFTLDRELSFAGHPTLGSCRAWLAGGGKPSSPGRIVQQCGAGLVELREIDGALAFAAPPLIRSGPVEDATIAELADFLGIAVGSVVAAQWVDNGPGWIGLLLDSADAVLALDPPPSWPRRIEVGVVGPHDTATGLAYEVRAFFSGERGAILEDPVTGSLNASLAGWLIDSGRVNAPYVARQGTALGRDGRISVSRGDGRIWIGGQTLIVAEGTTIATDSR